MSEEQNLVLYERRDAVAIVTLNRPRYRNAQNAKMTYALDDAFNNAVGDDEVKVIILRGAGKHFSAGHDIGSSRPAWLVRELPSVTSPATGSRRPPSPPADSQL